MMTRLSGDAWAKILRDWHEKRIRDDERLETERRVMNALGATDMEIEEMNETTAAPARKLLGCQTTGQCFCTGRCKRTAEEQAAHEALIAKPFVLGRDVFEPKPAHGPAPFDRAHPDAWIHEASCEAGTDSVPVQSALDTQIGGDHYKTMGEFQPWSVLQAWLTPEEFRGYMKGTAIAYLARERQKGGDQDVSKATHTLQGLIELLGAK